MTSSTQITSGTVQHAQQDTHSTDSQKTSNKPEPRTGSPTDHKGLYSSKRPAWTKSFKADRKKPGAAGMGTSPADTATLAESTGLPRAEQHIAAPGNPPAHILLLDEQDRATYTALWTELPAVPEHWKGPRVEQEERMKAMENIGTRQHLDAKSKNILQSRLATTEPSKERDELNEFQEQIAQSETDLHNVWSALQRNAIGMPLAKAASAA